MPPIMHMDSYNTCQQDADAVFCSAEFILVSDKPSPLLHMIKEFSEHRVAHYNHTLLRYGICVTQTCETFYEKNNNDLKLTLEACLNESLSKKYDLKVKLLDEYYCFPPGKTKMNIDHLDVTVGVICVIFLLLNVIGSVCEIYCYKLGRYTAIRVLLCFSIIRNWNKLTAPAGEGRESRLQLLSSIHGVRVMTMTLVVFGHSVITSVMLISNPEFIEQIYSVKFMYILLNGTLIMQTFLMIAAFLLVYTLLIYTEKHSISWKTLPKLFIIRWLRLTPSYAFILALTSTWFRHFSSGPLWSKYVAAETNDCRQVWWRHIFYINNYMKSTECMVQSWYLAVDMQLYIFALIVFVACKTARSRKIVLFLLFVIGMTINIGHVYLQDLDAIMIVSPETILNIFFSDPFFINVYTRSHTNIPGYIIGMTLGYLVYHWQKQEVDFKKHQTFMYRLLYWSSFPVAAWCCYSGGVFYSDAPRASVYIRMLYVAYSKAIFSVTIGSMIVASIFRYESLYRSILEWRAWTIPSRLSYSAYLMHVVIIRSYVASMTKMSHNDYFTSLQLGCFVLVMTMVAALIFWLLVEAPLSNIINCFTRSKAEGLEKYPTRTVKAKGS